MVDGLRCRKIRAAQKAAENAHRYAGARLRISQCDESVFDKPDEVGKKDQRRNQPRDIWAGRFPDRPMPEDNRCIDQHRGSKHRRGVFAQQSQAQRQSQPCPISHAPIVQRAIEHVSGPCPERHLRNVVVEFRRRYGKIIDTGEKQGARCGVFRREHLAPKLKHQEQRRCDEDLAQQINPEAACRIESDFCKPGGQRRVLIVAPLPFMAPWKHVADNVKRHAPRKKQRQHCPERHLENDETSDCVGGRGLQITRCPRKGRQTTLAKTARKVQSHRSQRSFHVNPDTRSTGIGSRWAPDHK